jgi:hypothetical protein
MESLATEQSDLLVSPALGPSSSASWFHFPNQVKWPAGVTDGNENIPNPHHRVETTLEEQSISSTFVYLFSF